MHSICIFIFVTIISGILGNEAPEITTPLGKVRGYLKTSYNDRKFMAFEGIPYAKPPIGKHRFNEPQPVEPWKGTWLATTLHECSQLYLDNKILGEEDCLYVNVYVPKDQPNQAENLDVVVHIHGGGFVFGSGHYYSKPEYLMDRNLIFVTLNYRLGVFGFLSTEDKYASGNSGLKDQSLALKWVQENIQSFGGNPNSVTITGMSAGGASVHLHYFSPLSKGLFHRGIAHSGVALSPWATRTKALVHAQKLAEKLGCSIVNTKVLMECLKRRPTKVILETVGAGAAFKLPPMVFGPVIEQGFSNKPFLPDYPYKMLTQNRVHDLPFITSNTADEGVFPGVFFYNDLETVNNVWEDMAAQMLSFHNTLPKSQWADAARKIKDFYVGENKNFTTENIQAFINIVTHRLFIRDAEIAARLQSKATKSPVYFYYFNYEGTNSFSEMFTPPGERFPGVCHMDDGIYMYPMIPNSKLNEEELQLKEAFLDMIESFAKTGVPEFKGVTWNPTGDSELTYLNISGPSDMKMTTAKEISPLEFWNNLGFSENENFVSIKDEL